MHHNVSQTFQNPVEIGIILSANFMATSSYMYT